MSEVTQPRPGGLVGMLAGLGAKSKGLLARIDHIAILLVLFAGIITIFKKNYTENPWEYAMWFGVSLGIAALLYEMSSAKAIARAVFNAKPGALFASVFIWAVAFGFSVNNWVGAASQSQTDKSNVHKAAYLATSDTRKTVTEAEARLARAIAQRDAIPAGRTAIKPWLSVADARAAIASATAHKIYRNSTSCTMTRGQTQREFCDNLGLAKADLARWDELGKANILVGEAEASLGEARSKASGVKIETSEGRGDLILLTKYAGMSEQDAQMFNGLGAIIAISIFLSFGSMRAEFERLSQTGRRQKFNAWRSLRRWFYRLLYNCEPENVVINYNGTQNGVDRGVLLRELSLMGPR